MVSQFFPTGAMKKYYVTGSELPSVCVRVAYSGGPGGEGIVC